MFYEKVDIVSYFSHYLTRSEIDVIKTSWCKLIGDETGSHGINMLIKYVIIIRYICISDLRG